MVDQVGEGVTGVSVGDAVFGLGSATYAEYAVLRAWAPKPERLSFAEAAGARQRRRDRPAGARPARAASRDRSCSCTAQPVAWARRSSARVVAGLRVIGTASEANHDLLRELGAEPVTYGDGLVSRVDELTPQVDGIIDTAPFRPRTVLLILLLAAVAGGLLLGGCALLFGI